MNMNFNSGVTVNHDLKGAAFATVTLVYKGKIAPPPGMDHFEIECEIYKAGDILSVHTVCPKCHHGSWIDGRNKDIEFNDRGLFVKKFKCGWEMGGEDDHHSFGFGLCQLELVYDGKVARDA